MDDMTPRADKWLHADGSVTTAAGEMILPADQSRAEEYANRAASADKWLKSDGSVVDMSGKEILPADETRAADYASRAARTDTIIGGTGGVGSLKITEDGDAILQPYIKESETLPADMTLFGDGVAFAFIPFAKAAETFSDSYQITDTASAVLS
jgi:hypothetical protein